MNPKVPDLLSRTVEIAARTIERSSDDPRQIEQIERLLDDVTTACDWPTDAPRRLVNDWTRMLLQMARRLERLGPLGEADEIVRAGTVARVLLPHVAADLLEARKIELNAGRERAGAR